MRYAFCLAALFAALSAVPAFAENGNVPQPTLEALGLADMDILSDEEGMTIRGSGGSAATMGISLVVGLIIEPSTKSFVFGSDANMAAACVEMTCVVVDPVARHATASGVALNLDVTHPDTTTFSGVLIGGAGGSGFASFP
jgi:hypothetical protein